MSIKYNFDINDFRLNVQIYCTTHQYNIFQERIYKPCPGVLTTVGIPEKRTD